MSTDTPCGHCGHSGGIHFKGAEPDNLTGRLGVELPTGLVEWCNRHLEIDKEDGR